MGVSVDKCREENIWEGNLFFQGGGVGGLGEGGTSQKKEAAELKLPAQCMLSISQVQGNLIKMKKKIGLAVLNNKIPKEAC